MLLSSYSLVILEAAVSKSLHESPRKKAKLDSDVKDISINLKVKSVHKSKGYILLFVFSNM